MSSNTKTRQSVTTDSPAATSAPVAATSAADARKAAISVAATKPAKEPKVPSFVVDTNLRTTLLGLTHAERVARIGEMKDIEFKDVRIFRINPDNAELKDNIVGSDLSRSGIRTAVIDFLRAQPDNQATGGEIAAYMHAGSGKVFKGKFNTGYLAARGADVRRGMVARKQLVIIAGTPPVDAPAEQPAEQPAAE